MYKSDNFRDIFRELKLQLEELWLIDNIYLVYSEYTETWYVFDSDYDLSKYFGEQIEQYGDPIEPDEPINGIHIWEYVTWDAYEKYPRLQGKTRSSCIRIRDGSKRYRRQKQTLIPTWIIDWGL